jgi:hypothetical protein
MRPLPTSTDHRTHVGGGLFGLASGPVATPLIRRAYFELVALRQHGGPSPLGVLADPRLAPALAALRDTSGKDAMRVAALTVLTRDGHDTYDAVMRAADALARHDIALDVWPQLDDAARFLCGATARTYQERLLPLVDSIEKSARPDIGLALDLEPPANWSTSAWSVARGALPSRAKGAVQLAWHTTKNAWSARQGKRDLTELARDLHARSLPVHVAVLPPVSADGELVRAGLMSVPSVDDTGASLFGTEAAMCYATSLQRMSARWDRARQKKTLALWAARHRTKSDAVALGLTSVGIFGDEPTYQSPQHLAEDVRAMEALGFSDIAVYALEGVWFGASGEPDSALTLRDDVEDWMAAMVGAFGVQSAPAVTRAAAE